ncbi:unnamed protein product [Prorocentrum cordatum]|uniref:Nuclear speckle splicing regulatory protein 1 N-terminal domain-containing protein n=1 Tax=Prorocentrum cordatum TaxID=2364126 RepID=A0ABN9RGS8_9DINO|nr:unnamed protein product [Polarella glacialis]
MHSLHHRKHQVFEEKRSCQEKEERSKWQQDYDSVMAKTKSPRNQSSLEEASARLYEDHVARRAGLEEMRRKVQHEHEQQIEATRFRRPASAANITPRGTTAPKGFVERTQEDAERRRKQREEADQQARPRSATRRARSISPAPGCTPRIAELYEDKARKARQEKLELAAKSELEQQHSFRPELKAKPGRAARPGLEARLEEMHREHAERLKRKKELAAKDLGGAEAGGGGRLGHALAEADHPQAEGDDAPRRPA